MSSSAQTTERYDIKKGVSRAARSHKCPKNTWFSANNFRFYKGIIQTVRRKKLELVAVPQTEFAACGAENWFSATSGLPYVNSGSSTAGLVDLTEAGLPNIVGGVFDVDFDNFGVAFPVACQDFTITMESRELSSSAWSSAFVFTDADGLRGYTFYYGDPDVDHRLIGLAKSCSLHDSIFGTNIQTHNESPPLSSDWKTVQLTRFGNLFIFIVNGVTEITYAGVSSIGALGIAHIGGGSHHQFRNINITTL